VAGAEYATPSSKSGGLARAAARDASAAPMRSVRATSAGRPAKAHATSVSTTGSSSTGQSGSSSAGIALGASRPSSALRRAAAATRIWPMRVISSPMRATSTWARSTSCWAALPTAYIAVATSSRSRNRPRVRSITATARSA
jgi:hypothetical protein